MENKNLEDLSKNDDEISSQTKFAQMYNGDAYVDQNTNLSYAEQIYGKDAPVEELGTD